MGTQETRAEPPLSVPSLPITYRVALFIVYTLKPSSVSERHICVDEVLDLCTPGEKTFPMPYPSAAYSVGALCKRQALRQREGKVPVAQHLPVML